MEVAESVEDLGAPTLPGLELDRPVVPLGLPQELLKRTGGHVLRDEDQSRQLLVHGLRAAAGVTLLGGGGGGGGGGGQGALLSCRVDVS